MPKLTKQSRRRGLFDKPATLSFQMEGGNEDRLRQIAVQRGIPISHWLREAVIEKLAREAVAK